MQFKIITKDKEWNETIKKVPESTVYHTSDWKKLVEKNGYKGYLIVAEEKDNVTGIFPVFTIKSKLFHLKQFMSIPFCDQESIIINEKTNETIKTLLKGLSNLVDDFKINKTILTTKFILPKEVNVFPRCRYYFKTQDLTEKKAWNILSKNTHRTIEKGIKTNLKVKVKNKLGIYDECERMYDDMLKRRNIKFFKYSRNFFKDFDKFMKEYLKVFFLRKGQKLFALAIGLNFNKTLSAWGFLTYSDNLNLNPGDFLMWEKIKWAIKNTCKHVECGTVPIGSELGLHKFKSKYKTHIEKTYLIHINHSFKSNFEDSISSMGKTILKII